MGGIISFDEIARSIDPFQSKGLDEGLRQWVVGTGDAAPPKFMAACWINRFPVWIGRQSARNAGIQYGIEDIENQPAANREMPVNAGEASALLARKGKMLKCAERHDRGREGLAEVKIDDVGFDEAEPLCGRGIIHVDLLPCGREHAFRAVNADDIKACVSERPGNSTGANAKLQDRTMKPSGAIDIKS